MKKKTKKMVRVKAWAVTVDGEICRFIGNVLAIYTSKTMPNKYQKVIPITISYEL